MKTIGNRLARTLLSKTVHILFKLLLKLRFIRSISFFCTFGEIIKKQELWNR